MSTNFANFPGIVLDLQDGGFKSPPAVLGPLAVVFGTSGTGFSNALFVVTNFADIGTVYDNTGTLVRGAEEVYQGAAMAGNPNIQIGLMRIGATPARLEGVAHTNAVDTGFTVLTAQADDSIGDRYAVSYDSEKDAIFVYSVDPDTGAQSLVYSNEEDNDFNNNEVYISGASGATSPDVGMQVDTGLTVGYTLLNGSLSGGETTVTVDSDARIIFPNPTSLGTAAMYAYFADGSYFSYTGVTETTLTGCVGVTAQSDNAMVMTKSVRITGDKTAVYEAGDECDYVTSGTVTSQEGVYRVGSVVYDGTTYTWINFNAKLSATWRGWNVAESATVTLRHQTPITITDLGNTPIDNAVTATIAVSGAADSLTCTTTDFTVGGIVYMDASIEFDSSNNVLETGFYQVKTIDSDSLTLEDVGGGSALSFDSVEVELWQGASVSGTTFTMAGRRTTSADTPSFFAGQRVYVMAEVDTESGYYYVRSGIAYGAPNTTFTLATTVGGSAVTFTSTLAVVHDLYAWNYVAGADNISLTKREMYEALERAYLQLEASNVAMAVPMDVELDCANVADDTTLTYTDDALLYLKTETVAGELTFTWKDYADLTALRAAQPDEAALYHEVNFAHQLARFCYGLSKNERSCSGTIGTTIPTSNYSGVLAEWYGALPTYDKNGNIAISGTGLLGNKFMVGSVERTGGFFATTTGEVDGVALKDKGGNNIDIGAYIDVTAIPVTLSNSWSNAVGRGAYTTSFAPTYAGFLMGLDVTEAPTNKSLNGRINAAFELTKTVLDDLIFGRYVVLNRSITTGLTKIVDGPTAARSTSDYNRRSTMRSVLAVLQEARVMADPYIGKLVDVRGREVLQSAINRMLQQRARDGYLTSGACVISATRAMERQGKATATFYLVPALELRQLQFVVNLS